MASDIYTACNVLLTTCSDSKQDEHLLFVTDPTSLEVAQAMWHAAKDYPNKTMVMMDERTMHGQDPNRVVAEAMAKADVIFGVTKFSLFHSQARRNAVARGARFVNMVDYNIKMLEQGGLYADFIEQGKVCARMGDAMVGETVTVTTPKGTYFTAGVKGRPTVPQYARSLEPGASSSPPDIECAIGAIEGTANGVVYVDGSIPHPELGLITDEIKLTIENSVITSITGGRQAQVLKKVMAGFNDEKVYWVGEIGVGLNPMCELNGRMLEDEGCAGTMHFGFGSNTGFHGTVESAYHLDMVFREPTLTVDGRTLLKDGKVTV